MTERVRSRTGAPTRWAGPAPDVADPTGGRHVLDQDAGLTPIFTTLRRGAWRRPRPQSGRRTLRPVPDPVQQFPDDPWTAPIPVVPALSAVEQTQGTGGYGPVDAYAPTTVSAVEPPVSATEATAWWGLPVVAAPRAEHEAYDRAGHDPYGSGPYDVAPRGAAPRGPASYGPPSYDPAPHVPAPHDRSRYQDPLPHQPPAYEPVLYGPPHRFPRHDPRAYEYDPLTDTGRHHRLAPAGW